MIKCSFCNYQNPEGILYCKNCGARLTTGEKKIKEPADLAEKKSFGRERFLVAEALEKKFNRPLERRKELAELIKILNLSVKNNPLLVGEPGVGKSTLIEALAYRIALQKVPQNLMAREIVQVDSSFFLKHSSLRGGMETKIEEFFQRVKKKGWIVFFDEIHALLDPRLYPESANAFKPYLLDQEIAIIGATNFEGLKKITFDPALERRFNVVLVSEPSAEETLEILKHLRSGLENHYQLKISDAVLEEAIKLSAYYFSDTFFPDKAINLIDRSCSLLASAKTTSLYEDVKESGHNELKNEHLCYEVSHQKNIPFEKVNVLDLSANLKNLEEEMLKSVFGQDEAVKSICHKLKTAFFFSSEKKRPLGIFLLLGPSGVGKTETARSLARIIFGSAEKLIRLDMSEYFDRHQLARLVGAPPGYIGYEEDGQLVAAVRKNPYSLILLDEIEKAHPDVLKIFLQIFDAGRLTDSKGRVADFSSTIIIMTSNAGSEIFSTKKVKAGIGFLGENGQHRNDNIFQQAQKALQKYFLPEFLNRIDEILFYRHLTTEILQKIASALLGDQAAQLREKGIVLKWTEQLVDLIIAESSCRFSGAREIQRTIERIVQYPLVEFLLHKAEQTKNTILIAVQNNQVVFSAE